MIERKYERRQSRALFDIFDRRRMVDRRELPAAEPAMPGMIRPGVNDEWDRVERRQRPGAGSDE